MKIDVVAIYSFLKNRGWLNFETEEANAVWYYKPTLLRVSRARGQSYSQQNSSACVAVVSVTG